MVQRSQKPKLAPVLRHGQEVGGLAKTFLCAVGTHKR